MDHLRQGIHLRGYGRREEPQAGIYKREAFKTCPRKMLESGSKRGHQSAFSATSKLRAEDPVEEEARRAVARRVKWPAHCSSSNEEVSASTVLIEWAKEPAEPASALLLHGYPRLVQGRP